MIGWIKCADKTFDNFIKKAGIWFLKDINRSSFLEIVWKFLFLYKKKQKLVFYFVYCPPWTLYHTSMRKFLLIFKPILKKPFLRMRILRCSKAIPHPNLKMTLSVFFPQVRLLSKGKAYWKLQNKDIISPQESIFTMGRRISKTTTECLLQAYWT